MYKLLTVDVWDTLLRRDCHPECIKLATAAYVFGFNERIVCSSYKSHWEIYQARIEIECTLADRAEASGFDREYDIFEVFNKWLEKICNKKYSFALSEHLVEYELNVEIERSYADPGIVEFISKIPAEKKIFLSDFYMKSSILNRLLDAKGFGGYLNDGISSCDYFLNKRSGRVFKNLHEKYEIKSSEHVHIGDNEWSDVECPRSIGIDSKIYKPETQHNEREHLESLFSSRSLLFTEMMHKVNLIQSPADLIDSPKKIASFRLGLAMSPLFVGFVLSVVEQSIADKIDKIFYLTREGEFLKKIHDGLFSDGSKYFGHPVPFSDLLEVSRLSTFLPSLTDTSPEELARMWRIHGRQSIEGFFSTLGYSVADFQDLLDYYKIKRDEVIVAPENDPRFIELIQSNKFSTVIISKMLDQKRLLTNYLYQKNISDGMRVGLVDVGWRGSIQDNLSKICNGIEFSGHYLALKKFVEVQPANAKKNAWLINESVEFDAIKSKCLEAYAVIEMLCNSDSGSVVGYSDGGGVVCAEKNIDALENNSYNDFAKYFQEGVLAASPLLNNYINRYVVSPSEMRDLALNIWYIAGSNPEKELVDVFMTSSQHDMFSFGDIFKRSDLPSLAVIFKSFFIKKHRKSVIQFVGRVQWTAAIRKMNGVGMIHRNVLMLIFVVANFYRRCKVKFKNRSF
jgi:FMN phosphatase YigB (HAD superfamily)